MVRWGILSTGPIAHDFCANLFHNSKTIHSVCSRTQNSAQAFAKQFNISHAFDSVEDFLNEDVDIIYVAHPHPYHFEFAKMAIERGKNLLIEKPMTCSLPQTEKLIELSQKHQTFLAEGFWTFCFPAYGKIRELIDSGTIGDIVNIASDFWFLADRTPGHRYWTTNGGGALLDVGVYPLAAALFLEGSQAMPEVVSKLHIDPDYNVDVRGSCVLQYPNMMASLHWGFDCDSKEETIIMGSKGNITINSPAHCPTSFTLSLRGEERGTFTHETFTYDLPKFTSHTLNFPNSEGFGHEINAVEEALKSGLKECPQIPLHLSLRNAHLVDQIFLQNRRTALHGPLHVTQY